MGRIAWRSRTRRTDRLLVMKRFPPPLPKRSAEKIESKFSEAWREEGSAAGCVTARAGTPGAKPHRRISADLFKTNRAKRASP